MTEENVPAGFSGRGVNKKLILGGCAGIAALVVGLFVVAIVAIVIFGGSDKSAIESVLAQDALTTEEATSVAEIVQRMKSIDTSDCPADFREAYYRHIRAWQGMAEQVASEPQSFGEGFLYGLIKGFEGDYTGGLGEINEARNYCSQQIKTTFQEVEAIAIRYGARLQTME